MKLHHRIFQLFVLLLPTQLAFHLWPTWSFVSGIRIDYLSPTIYFTDIILILLVSFWIIEERPRLKNKNIVLPLIAFLVFVLLNIIFAFQPFLALYKWLKVLEVLLLIFYVASERLNLFGLIKTPLSLAIVYTSFIAFAQIALQRTLGGLFYLLGERSFTVGTPGIALVNFFGRALMRPYATFGHPNALAGFLLIAVFILLVSKRRGAFTLLAIIVGSLALCLTFSLNAVVSFVVMFLLIKLQSQRGWASFKKNIVFQILTFSLLLPLISQVLVSNNLVSSFELSLKRRLVLSEISGLLVSSHPLFGIGLGNFIPSMIGVLQKQNFLVTETIWWLQPVHNIYLLVLVETGIIGFLSFGFLIYKLLTKTKSKLDIGLILILLTGFLDHYWLTLQQNLLLGAILAGFLITKDLVQYKHAVSRF